MNLHQNKELFSDAVLAASQRFSIQEIYVEKDYWITLALYTIFQSPVGNETVFKGGTALSKAFKLIERFSEDIDLVVTKTPGEEKNRLKDKLTAISGAVGTVMPEIVLKGVTSKRAQIRKTIHQYPKAGFKGAFGHVRENIIVESTWMGNHEPNTEKEIDSYIARMMVAAGQEDLVEKYGMAPFTVRVLAVERTFCEKIMSMVRFSYTQTPYEDLGNKVRHIYDIHFMLKDAGLRDFFNAAKFGEMLLQVARDDVSGYRKNRGWIAKHPAEAKVFSEPDETWDKIKPVYLNDFSGLVIGALPGKKEILATIKTVSARLAKLKWEIKLP